MMIHLLEYKKTNTIKIGFLTLMMCTIISAPSFARTNSDFTTGTTTTTTVTSPTLSMDDVIPVYTAPSTSGTSDSSSSSTPSTTGAGTSGTTTSGDATTSAASSIIIGCNGDIEAQSNAIRNALTQAGIDTANEKIEQPTSADIMTCAEQRNYNDVSATFSQPDGGGTTFLSGLDSAFSADLSRKMSSIVPGTAEETALNAYNNSVSAASSSALNTNCTVMDELWALTGCEPFGGIISLNDILANQMENIANALEDIAEFPSRLQETVCRAAANEYTDFINDVDNAIDDNISAYTDPVTDRIYDATDGVIDNVEDNIHGIYDL